MEEIRSTEALGREILEDARKKAHKIMNTSEEALDSQNRDWEKKTNTAIESLKKNYADRIKREGEEISARSPMDKRRLRSEFYSQCLEKAMHDFLNSLPRAELLSILEKELSEHLQACEEDFSRLGADVLYSGMDLSEAEELLKKLPLKGSLKKDPNAYELPSLVIDTKAVRISVSVESAASSLLKDKRSMLAAALLGEGVLND